MKIRAFLSVLSFSLLAINLFTQNNFSASLATEEEFRFSDPTNTPIALEVASPFFEIESKTWWFSWDVSFVPNQATISYDLYLYKKAIKGLELISKTSTTNNFQQVKETFNQNSSYFIRIDTKVSTNNSSEKIKGELKKVEFKKLPDCTEPTNLLFEKVGLNSYHFEWDGASAIENEMEYEIKIVLGDKGKSFETINETIKTGSSFDFKNSDNIISAQLRKLCLNEGLESNWVKFEIQNETADRFTLPGFNCGDPFHADTMPGYTFLFCEGDFYGNDQQMFIDSIIYIGGFPIYLDTIYSRTDNIYVNIPGVEGQPQNRDVCLFSGTGVVPLPFGETAVRVEFEDILLWFRVDHVISYTPKYLFEYSIHVADGTVNGMWDLPQYFPDLNPSTLSIGDDICIVPPSKSKWDTTGLNTITGTNLDPNGFDIDGNYNEVPPYPGWVEGNPYDTTGTYDPWGFDSNGRHRETGTTTNPNGCSREDLLANPASPPCDSLPEPYSWMNEDPPTLLGSQFANSVKDTLAQMITRLLNNEKGIYQDSLNSLGPICQKYRDSLNVIVDRLDYDRFFVFGENDEFLNPGMHELYETAPLPYGVNMERDPDDLALETNHLALYECDKNLFDFQDYISVINDLLNGQVNQLKDDLLEIIKRLSEGEVSQINGQAEFEAYVLKFLREKVNQEYSDLFGFEFKPNKNLYENGFHPEAWSIIEDIYPSASTSNPIYSTATIENNWNLNYQENQKYFWEDLKFQLKQGWQEVNGVHRAFVLEKISSLRSLPPSYVDNILTEHDSLLMPIVVKNRADDGRLYQIYLDNIVFEPYFATLDAYMVLELPNNGQRIVFQALDVRFYPTGPKVFPVKLNLLNNTEIRISNSLRLNLNGDNGNTFVSFDCDGFAGLGIEAEIEICRDYVIPIDPITKDTLLEPERVSGTFITTMSSWGDFYVNFSIDPFVIRGIEDYKWMIDSIYFDYSEVQSPTGSPPPGYEHPFVNGGFNPRWKGFYVSYIEVEFPSHFKSTNPNPLSAGVSNVVIDDLGFSGSFFVKNLLALADGNAEGWAISIDSFYLDIAANQLKSAELSGLIHVPLFSENMNCSTGTPSENDCFAYNAMIDIGNRYLFKVDMGENNYCVNMWKAGRVILERNSGITMQLEDSEFLVEARLTGKFELGVNLGSGKSLDVPEISFQDLVIRNRKVNGGGYFEPGLWKFPGSLGANFGGFGFSISRIGMGSTIREGYEETYLGFTVGLKLTGSEKINLKADGSFKLNGTLEYPDGIHQRWVYSNFELNQFTIDGSFPGVDKIFGQVTFYDEQEGGAYGSGFRGVLKVNFKALKTSISLDAIEKFGKATDT
ncbi:MAG: hypothetical protein R2784_10645 [Saprospiraceae bacterium]